MDKDLLPFAERTTLACSDIEKLIDYYVDGELPALLLNRFNSHLSSCELCTSLVHDVGKIVEMAKTLDHQILPFAVRERLRARLKEELGQDLATGPKLVVVK